MADAGLNPLDEPRLEPWTDDDDRVHGRQKIGVCVRFRQPLLVTAAALAVAVTVPGVATADSTDPASGSVTALDTASGVATSSDAPAGAPGSVGSLAPEAPIAPCPGGPPEVTTFGEAPAPVLGWTENLAFDGHERMWVSKTFLDRVDAYAPDGRVVASVAVHAPGGIALGPDGRMHVATGTGYFPERSDLATFDPAAHNPEVRIEAELDSRKNGLAVDSDGNSYLTGLDDETLTKVTPEGEIDVDWARAAGIGGANGIVIEGDTAFVSRATSESVVHSVPLDRPEDSTATILTTAPVPARGLDDLDITPEALYVTSWTTGEVFRIDRATGDACVLVNGIPRATSVLVADGFGEYGERDLMVTSLHGPIRHVALE